MEALLPVLEIGDNLRSVLINALIIGALVTYFYLQHRREMARHRRDDPGQKSA